MRPNRFDLMRPGRLALVGPSRWALIAAQPVGADAGGPVGADAAGSVGVGGAGGEAAGGRISVAVVASVPENPAHQRKTVDALLRLIRGSRELAGCPEPTPAFPPYLDRLVRTIVEFVN
jgi:hypothetical protein